MDELQRVLAGVVVAHRGLAAHLAGLTDERVRQPSLLPGWSVGHVLTHIARNADGLRTMLEGAMRGEIVAMYPGGLEQRTADIETGAARSATELCSDVVGADDRLEAAFAAMDADAWAGSGLAAFGPVAMREVPTRRRTEVEVHHIDLGLGYTWRDWPADFVRVEVQRLTMLWNSRQPMGLAGLPAAALTVDEHHRAAWLLGRADIDGVEPARLMG
jgi:maleylpyruvate isomerase